MNDDLLQGRWKQVKGQIRQWWAKLTDEDVEKIGGRTEALISLLQARYGYTREHAQVELEQRLREFGAPVSSMMPK